ncbi:Molybdenum cofactor sulfurase [Hyphodiscus hymeniophilus]|uniref:Molybdenum cofactor sulfurase n=1 Tax=Hyphodiscus hymeniophilus TaxID=353542 RepID=A0A9P6VNQ8_9HELO|nr:Molybdenum cofactor sulfurase [Hyphodiscus hymeniophilus]
MAYNNAVEEFRDEEYPMMKGKVYLDHGGTTIYSKSLIEAFSEKMITNLYGNPHSASDPAKLSGDEVDSIREKALRFFKADPAHFDLVFTANASAAIKLVGESFRDLAVASSVSGAFWFGYHKDSHNSVVGIREYADSNQHCFVSDDEVEQWLSGYAAHINSSTDGSLPGLFAYPGQSNMTGRRLPLSWTATLRQSPKPHLQNTYSLLDAAALATTTQLDLSDPENAPDFVALSFYKIFGFPDLGALIIRKKSGHILSWRRYFGGGTVNGVTVLHEATMRRRNDALHEGLGDGTLPFHSIVALGCALDVHKKLYGCMKAISRHTSFLGHRLYTRVSSLSHYNGRPACVVYNDIADYTDPTRQGSTVAFNLVRADGTFVRYSQVEQLANDRKIYLRAGGLCNPGGIASLLKIEPWQFKRAWSAGHNCGDVGDTEIINGKPTGVVRASLGAMSTVSDVDTFIQFVSETFVEHPGQELAIPKLETLHQNPSRTGFQDGGYGISNFNAEARVIPPPPRLAPQRGLAPIHSRTQLSAHDAGNEIRRLSPESPTRRYQHQRQNIQHLVPLEDEFENRDTYFDVDTEGAVAHRPPPLNASSSAMSLPVHPTSRTKRSLFTKKSNDSYLLPPNEMSPGTTMTGKTLSAEDAELQELIKNNLVLGEERIKGKSMRFWKGGSAKDI